MAVCRGPVLSQDDLDASLSRAVALACRPFMDGDEDKDYILLFAVHVRPVDTLYDLLLLSLEPRVKWHRYINIWHAFLKVEHIHVCSTLADRNALYLISK